MSKNRILGRRRTHDVAFTYRMGAGFAGDVNRTHPASIEPALIDAAAPPTLFGQPVIADAATQGVKVLPVNYATAYIYGITVRPYPFQQQTGGMAASFGGEAPAPSGVIDVLRAGYIMVPVVGTPAKGGTVYIWTAAGGGGHVQGGFEAANPGGSGIALDAKSTFNGPPDANGICEVAFNI